MNLVLDSSVIIANLHEGEPHSRVTHQFFTHLQQSSRDFQIIVPMIVPIEVANILVQYGELLEKPGGMTAFWQRFAQYELIDVTRETAEQLVALFHHVHLRTNDAIIAATASLYEAMLVSWDARLIKEGSKLVSAMTPQDFLK